MRQVQTIVVRESDETGEMRHARDALLLWCQLKTADYPQVEVVDFTSSWRDGLAFCALLHRHWPSLIDYDHMLDRDVEPWHRIEIAFRQASDHLGIPRLIEPTDLFETCWSDERCILTVVVTWYQCLTNSLSVQLRSSRLNHVLTQCVTISQMAQRYLDKLRRWLQWVNTTRRRLAGNCDALTTSSMKFPDPESWIRDQLKILSEWSQTEKSDRMLERSELEFLLHTIHIRQLAVGHNRYYPPEGFRSSDVDGKWKELISVERSMHLTILDELTKQANLKHLGRRFDRKLSIFAAWLAENEQLLCVTERSDAVSFQLDMSFMQDVFVQVASRPSLKDFHAPNLTSKLYRITTARRKHAAWLADAEAYVEIRSQRLRGVLAELQRCAEHTAETVDRGTRWTNLANRWSKLQSRFELRTRCLKAVEDWLYCLVDVHDLIDSLCFRLAELNTCDTEQTVQIEVTLKRIKDELDHLDRWANLVEVTCLTNNGAQNLTEISSTEATECLVMSDLHTIASECVKYVRAIHTEMSRNLINLGCWNDQKHQAYGVLNEINEEMEWVQVSPTFSFCGSRIVPAG
ncbi:unnamed protein product [Echinostoma caproni]|uniref:Calponin-homology (CH) domain-containing protein n=1 Tax=Echinostoma caproni TaxID=27848 RepID=A0A183AHF0_9TREM|nr:unnamed protein product [Echinostoma caproni]